MRLRRKDEWTAVEYIQAAVAVLLVYWSFRYAGGGADPLALVSAGVLGLALVALAGLRTGLDEGRQDAMVAALGFVAVFSPLLLGFTDVAGAKKVHVFAGIVVMTLTGLKLGVRFLDQRGETA
jgi:hypothetical protein